MFILFSIDIPKTKQSRDERTDDALIPLFRHLHLFTNLTRKLHARARTRADLLPRVWKFPKCIEWIQRAYFRGT